MIHGYRLLVDSTGVLQRILNHTELCLIVCSSLLMDQLQTCDRGGVNNNDLLYLLTNIHYLKW